MNISNTEKLPFKFSVKLPDFLLELKVFMRVCEAANILS